MPVASYWPLPAPYVPPANPGYPAPALGEDDFVAELADLFPPGPAWAWARDLGSVGIGLLRALAASQAAIQARKNQLLLESPTTIGTLVELLPEWEKSVGLPDPCAGPDALVVRRQAHVLARLKNKGGQSATYLIDYAFALGFVITITPFTVFRCGMRIGGRVRGARWASALQINAAETTITYARAGSARAGDRLATWGNAVLECELRRVAPGHATLIFSYG